MSRITKNAYSSFSREILAEFLTFEELAVMDLKYTSAKITRANRAIEMKAYKGTKLYEEAKNMPGYSDEQFLEMVMNK